MQFPRSSYDDAVQPPDDAAAAGTADPIGPAAAVRLSVAVDPAAPGEQDRQPQAGLTHLPRGRLTSETPNQETHGQWARGQAPGGATAKSALVTGLGQ